ncbi:putative porin [Chitinophagaceae bacterium LWZ2-11]
MKALVRNTSLLIILVLALWGEVRAQTYPPIGTVGTGTGSDMKYDNQGRPMRAPKKDSLQHRDKYADSITIYFKMYDSTRARPFDSSINDFSKQLPQPYYSLNLGNFGTATESLLFSPLMKPGWDPGFHQYDNNKFTIEGSRFFQTTRPYTELAYMLGSKSEQYMDILHTQNHKTNFNFSLEYRFNNSRGLYQNQNASQNNFRFTAHYQSPNKRYEGFLILISSKAASSENGGLVNPKQLDSLALNDPYELSTRLGPSVVYSSNFFNTTVNTGNIYKESTLLYRHQYDFGQKDSLVTDSVTYKLFYARFRLQHTLQYSGNSYTFQDNSADSTKYGSYFNFLPVADTFYYRDKWSNLINEFSVLSFPDKNNQAQFAKVGIAMQNLKGTFGNDSVYTTQSYYNVYALGEYRNRTKNNVWDIEATGKLYLNGLNSGDYAVNLSLRRQLSKKLGYLTLGFQNVNKTPSAIFMGSSETDFPIQTHSPFKKENITRLSASYINPRLGLKLGGEYYLMSNYTYSDSFFIVKQQSSLFNVLHLSAEKVFKLAKHFNWYLDLHVQQTAGDAPINIPNVITRSRFAFEGNYYTNLWISTGVEIRYYTNYKADNYSPFTGMFFVQNSYTTSNRPDVNLFLHVRIKGFKLFTRFENLNTLNLKNGFSFNKYNFTSQLYPEQGLWFRLGVWWSFVN